MAIEFFSLLQKYRLVLIPAKKPVMPKTIFLFSLCAIYFI